MKKFVTYTQDTCWRDCIASLLEVKPKKVPNFVKLYESAYMDETRDWLRDKYGKGLVYIPAKQFMETSRQRDNPPIGPSGYSMAHLSMVDDRSMHVAIAFNGGIVYDNGDDRHAEYDVIHGYYVIYDLEPGRAKKQKRGKKALPARGRKKKGG